MNVNERPYLTNPNNKNVLSNDLIIIDKIADDHLRELKSTRNINLWDANVALYASAISLLEIHAMTEAERYISQRSNQRHQNG